MELSVIHPYQSKVQALKTRLQQAGTSITHSEALRQVAEQEGYTAWHQLPQEFERSLTDRIRAAFCFQNRWRRTIRVGLEELFYDHPDNRLRFGVYGYEGESIDVEMDWARRHVLLMGPSGKGASVAMEHLMAQQLVAGGGLIVFDTTADIDSAETLKNLSELSGRNDFQNLALETSSVDQLVPSIERVVQDAASLYLHISYLRVDPDTPKMVSQALQHLENLVRAKKRDGKSANSRPLMLVFPDGPCVLTREWLPFLRQARAFNIMVVIRLFGTTDLSRLDADLADAILNCGTKVFFQPSSVQSLEGAAELLAMSKNEETLEAARTHLTELGLGDSIVSREGEHYRCKTCILNLS